MTKRWRLIKTAPKPDILGPYILVVDKRGHRDLAFWDAGWYSASNHDGYQHGRLKPTHWMPLPDPPK